MKEGKRVILLTNQCNAMKSNAIAIRFDFYIRYRSVARGWSLVLEVFGACKMCLHGKSGRKTSRIDSRVLLFNFLASVALDVVMRAHRK